MWPKGKHPILHIYAQDCFHGTAHIVGTKKSLEALREAIDFVLEQEGEAQYSTQHFVGDGEGFDAIVIKIEEDVTDPDTLPVPYTEEWACEKRDSDKLCPFWEPGGRVIGKGKDL